MLQEVIYTVTWEEVAVPQNDCKMCMNEWDQMYRYGCNYQWVLIWCILAGRRGSNILAGWLSKIFDSVVTQWCWDTRPCWCNAEEKLQKLKEINKLEWIHHVLIYPTLLFLRRFRDHIFHKSLRNFIGESNIYNLKRWKYP